MGAANPLHLHILFKQQARISKKQIAALKALQDLLHTQPLSAVQVAFRSAKGFTTLVAIFNSLIEAQPLPRLPSVVAPLRDPASSATQPFATASLTTTTPDPDAIDPDIAAAVVLAVSVLTELVRNNAINRQAALQAGALAALASLVQLATGPQGPLCVDVLRCLYVFVAGDTSGYLIPDLLDNGTIDALCVLLQQCAEGLQGPLGVPSLEAWVQEVLCILYVLARRSRAVAAVLTTMLTLLTQLLSLCWQPICLSLGLDILEELLHSTDSESFVQDFVLARGVQATVRCLHMHGLGNKVVLLWSRMSGDEVLRQVLVKLLDVEDTRQLIQLAGRARDAEDLDASASRTVLQALAEADRLAVMQHVVACRSLLRALRIEGLSAQLAVACCSVSGASLVANMSSYAPAEVAIAACHLLDKAPRLYTTVLRHGPTLRALIAAVCDQCCGVESPTSPASSVVPPGTPGGGAGPHSMPMAALVLRRESAVEAAMAHDAHSTPAAALLSLLGFVERKRGGRRPSLGAAQDEDMAAGPSRQPPVQPPSTTPSDTYESVKFIVGGRECYALSWLLETASSVIANRIMAASLAADPGTRFQSVTVPPVPGLEPARQHALFGMAVEWLYSGGSVEPPAEALIDLWAMAAVLQMRALQQYVERRLASSAVLDSPSAACRALDIAEMHRVAADTLRNVVVKRLLGQLPKQLGSVPLGVLLSKHFDLVVDTGASVLLQELATLPTASFADRAPDLRPSQLSIASAGSHPPAPLSTTGPISADSAADWSRQLSSVFVKKAVLGGSDRGRTPPGSVAGE